MCVCVCVLLVGQEVKRVLLPLREERQKRKRVRSVITNEDYPEVEYKDDNGDTVTTEREWVGGSVGCRIM